MEKETGVTVSLASCSCAHPHIISPYLVTPQPRQGQVWSEQEDNYSAGTFKLLIRQQSLAAWRGRAFCLWTSVWLMLLTSD